jgi:predicted DNA binding CopG/RHH family protein
MKTIELTKQEKKIEESINQLKPLRQEKMKQVEAIIAKARKDKAISLRIATYDLEKIKEKAEKNGVPYQTLITTVLHKYVTDQLFEKEEILRSIKILKEGAT